MSPWATPRARSGRAVTSGSSADADAAGEVGDGACADGAVVWADVGRGGRHPRDERQHLWYLWLLSRLAAASVAAGTLVLFAVLGARGSSLRCCCSSTSGSRRSAAPCRCRRCPGFSSSSATSSRCDRSRPRCARFCTSISQWDAGRSRGVIAAEAGLIFLVALGATVVSCYERKGLARMRPDLLAYHRQAVRATQPREMANRSRSRRALDEGCRVHRIRLA